MSQFDRSLKQVEKVRKELSQMKGGACAPRSKVEQLLSHPYISEYVREREGGSHLWIIENVFAGKQFGLHEDNNLQKACHFDKTISLPISNGVEVKPVYVKKLLCFLSAVEYAKENRLL